jgi:hypothetical protein
MIDMEWEKIVIIILTFVLGMSIGHVQEAKWSDIRENALKVQIERQQCTDVSIWKH